MQLDIAEFPKPGAYVLKTPVGKVIKASLNH